MMFFANLFKSGAKGFVALFFIGFMLMVFVNVFKVCGMVTDKLTSDSKECSENTLIPDAVSVEVITKCDSIDEQMRKIVKQKKFTDNLGNEWAYCGFRYYNLFSLSDFYEYNKCVSYTPVDLNDKKEVDRMLRNICIVAIENVKTIKPNLKEYNWGSKFE
jgi:hypothetical protein